VQIPPRRFTVFWGSVPHNLMECREEASYYALHLPLAWFMSWELPLRFVRRVLEGEIAFESRREQDVADAILFKQWLEDLEQGDPVRQQVVLREVCARLHRLAVTLEEDKAWLAPEREIGAVYGGGRAEQIASYIVQHFLEDLTVPQVAAHVGLHPKYASQLFSNKCGISIKRYITLNRLHRAELLLVTTDKSVLDVAMESGFGSESTFYGAFRKFIGHSPAAYRHLMRKGAAT
jgi:AraC-like DNA-binding protein